MAANILDSIIEYTSIPVYKEEVVISAGSSELLSFPFVFMTGHKLVRFSSAERDNLRRFTDAGGLLFSDDCNHDVNGLYARSFEQEMRATFPDEALAKLPAAHPIYRSFFTFKGGPPRTSHELNGWGDNIVHDTSRRSSGAAASACSTATRTTAASGTTTGATSASCVTTTRSSPSTSSSTRWRSLDDTAKSTKTTLENDASSPPGRLVLISCFPCFVAFVAFVAAVGCRPRKGAEMIKRAVFVVLRLDGARLSADAGRLAKQRAWLAQNAR